MSARSVNFSTDSVQFWPPFVVRETDNSGGHELSIVLLRTTQPCSGSRKKTAAICWPVESGGVISDCCQPQRSLAKRREAFRNQPWRGVSSLNYRSAPGTFACAGPANSLNARTDGARL